MQVFNIPLDSTHQETTHHGSYSFPIAIYTTQISRNILGFIDWHWHQELQFCVVLNGVVDFYVNQSHFIIKEGDGIFINAGQLHMARNHGLSDSTYICLDFHPRMISNFAGSIIESKYVSPYLADPEFAHCFLSSKIKWQEQILDTLLEISSNYHSNTPDEMQITLQLGSVWHTLISSKSEVRKALPDTAISPQVREIMQYIRDNYMNNISLDTLADMTSLARSSCCRKFKKQTSCTISEFILNVRLQEASRLLLTSDYTITEISMLCGFNDSSYFTKEFRLKTGISPSMYRKEKSSIKSEILSTI